MTKSLILDNIEKGRDATPDYRCIKVIYIHSYFYTINILTYINIMMTTKSCIYTYKCTHAW